MPDDSPLAVRRGGSGDATLLLLHGLGATAAVWDGLTELLDDAWPGEWVAPDLPGHGASAPLSRYSFGGLAAAVAPLVEPGRRTVVLGHSLGGVLALTLASGWFGLPVATAIGVGIKLDWSADELTKAAELAARPARVFDDRAQAVDRAIKVAGLAGLVTADSPFAESAVLPAAGGHRLALDQAAFGVGAPDIAGLLAAARAAVRLAAGERDPMCTPAQLAAFSDSVVLSGLGHNAHVEDPAAVLALLG